VIDANPGCMYVRGLKDDSASHLDADYSPRETSWALTYDPNAKSSLNSTGWRFYEEIVSDMTAGDPCIR